MEFISKQCLSYRGINRGTVISSTDAEKIGISLIFTKTEGSVVRIDNPLKLTGPIHDYILYII